MNRKALLVLVLALGLLAVTAAVALSWDPVDPSTGIGPDFMISLPLDHQADPAVVYNPDYDEYLVVWWDNRGDDTDIYGQFVSASGISNQDNFTITVVADEQSYPLVAYNSTDQNYMVVWRDKRGGSLDYDIYGQVIGANGVLSGTNFMVSADGDDQKPWDLVHDPNTNHYLVVWVDVGDDLVEGQMLDAAGNLIGTNAFVITVGVGGDHPRAAYDSIRSSYMVVYDQDQDIYGQAIAADGTLTGTMMTICDDAADQTYPDLAFNPSTGEYLVAWQDTRSDGVTGTDVYARRMDQDGNLQGSADTVISDAADTQRMPHVAYNSRVNQWLVAWEDYRNSSASGIDLYGQRVTSAGDLAGQGNFMIYDGPNNQGDVALAARPTTTGAEYLAVWEDHRGSDGLEVLGQRIGALLGTINWHDFNVSAPLDTQEEPAMIYNAVDQQFFVVWQDLRGGDWDIYAQIVLTSGIPITDNIVVQDEANNLVESAVAHSTASNSYLVVWNDQNGGNIEERAVSATGALGSVHSVVVDGSQPAIAYNSTADEYLIVFRSSSSDISGRRAAVDGTFPTTAFTISVDAANQSSPHVAYNATDDEYLVVWSDERSDQGDVYGKRVDAAEMLLGDDFVIAAAADAQAVPSVDWNNDNNEYLVVWHDYRDSGVTGADIYGRRVGADSSLLDSEIVLSDVAENQQYPHVRYISDYDRYSVVWQDARNVSSDWDIYAQSVNADGSLYMNNAPRFIFSGFQLRPSGDFSPEAGRGLTVWMDGRNGASYKIYGRMKEMRFAIYLPLVLRNS
ncbi:MAG: hypothetical protein GY832_16065 [Chloroflexi bacterium]|nr:hypothetical protein [Chloroflexota bacterium]